MMMMMNNLSKDGKGFGRNHLIWKFIYSFIVKSNDPNDESWHNSPDQNDYPQPDYYQA